MYRAGSAEYATRQRARRSADTSGGPTKRAGPPTNPQVRQFVDRFAEMMRATGMPRTPARVLAALLVSDSGALTAAELGEQLEVSPAAVSKAVRFLEAFALVSRERPVGQRREVYRFTGDWAETFARRDALFAPWEMGAREGARLVGAQTPAGHRLAEMARFMRHTRDTIRRVRREWR
ncbi:GbsR/MarR family transcriptional regulator [Mycobacterium sp. SMC-4]|uniref:GbsR/MarR family transcriptional regulator n=1 Tax=Mycobacterium sp. SMC-4 TaxID=2857059 RepID=UPI0037C9AEF7